MQWRKAWRNNWQAVRYCSLACRRKEPAAQPLRAALLRLAEAWGKDATFCPSEASREVFGAQAGLAPEAMERTRRIARLLVAEGALTMLQRGRAVDPSTAKGPIRLRRT